MATTVTDANLTVTISDSITLNGQSYGNTNILTVGSIDEVYSRVISLPVGAYTSLFELGTLGKGSLTAANVKYFRITNLDDTNFINLKLFGADSVVFKLEAGKSFVMGGVGFDSDSADIAQGAEVYQTGLIAYADANTDIVDVEILVASV
jgi:hypothetical protein|tara:strand:+ start:9624 stop:10073 length:450 start_codon:yes stop_codon:yes gene_type:complete